MNRYFQDTIVQNLASPYGLAILSTSIFLLAILFPPSIYYFYVGEPDLIFLNFEAILYFAACVLAFFCGLRIFFMASPVRLTPTKLLTPSSPLAFLLVPLLAGTAVCLVSTAALASNLPNLGTLLLAQQGDLIKLAGLSGGTAVGYWRTCSTFCTATLWWSYWRCTHTPLGTAARRLFSVCFFVSLICDVFACILRVDRTALMPILAGLFVLYLQQRIAVRRVPIVRAGLIVLGVTILLVGAFTLLSFLRGAAGAKTLISLFLGYTLASYNRLAALLSGQMIYLYHGTGIYLAPAYSTDINNLLHLQNLPNSTDAWFSEFVSTATAGLNPMYIWSGAFGYLYSDLQWWTPVYLFVYGLLYAAIWKSFLRQSAVGIILYPWFAFNILFWVGSNYLLDTKVLLLLLTGLALATYEKLFANSQLKLNI